MATSIIGALTEQLEKGVNMIDDIAKATGLSNSQLYFAGRELIKAGKARQAISGHHGAICLNDQPHPTNGMGGESVIKTEEPMVEAPAPLASVTVPVVESFDFNQHFNQFIGRMTSVALGQIDNNVKAQVGPIAEALSTTLVNEVESAVRAKLEPMGKTLCDEIANNIKQATDRLLSNLTTNIAQAIGCMSNVSLAPATSTVSTVLGEVKPETKAEVIEAPTYFGQEPPQLSEAKVVRIRLPKICVANLKPIQMGELQQEFCRTFDISFWNDRTGSSNQQLSDYSRNCEKVFWHTKHCNHGCESIVRRDGGDDKLVRVNGGLAQMKEALMAFYNEIQKAA